MDVTVVDEDPFPLVALIYIATIEVMRISDEAKGYEIPLSLKKKKV